MELSYPLHSTVHIPCQITSTFEKMKITQYVALFCVVATCARSTPVSHTSNDGQKAVNSNSIRPYRASRRTVEAILEYRNPIAPKIAFSKIHINGHVNFVDKWVTLNSAHMQNITNFEKFCEKHINLVRYANTRRGMLAHLEKRKLNDKCPSNIVDAMTSGSPDFQLMADQFVKAIIQISASTILSEYMQINEGALKSFVHDYKDLLRMKTDDPFVKGIIRPFAAVHNSLQSLFAEPIENMSSLAYMIATTIIYFQLIDDTNIGEWDFNNKVVDATRRYTGNQLSFRQLPNILLAFVKFHKRDAELSDDLPFGRHVLGLIDFFIKSCTEHGLPVQLYYSKMEAMQNMSYSEFETLSKILNNTIDLNDDVFYVIDYLNYGISSNNVTNLPHEQKLDILDRILKFENSALFYQLIDAFVTLPEFDEHLALYGSSFIIKLFRERGEVSKEFYKQLSKRADSDAQGMTPFNKDYIIDLLHPDETGKFSQSLFGKRTFDHFLPIRSSISDKLGKWLRSLLMLPGSSSITLSQLSKIRSYIETEVEDGPGKILLLAQLPEKEGSGKRIVRLVSGFFESILGIFLW